MSKRRQSAAGPSEREIRAAVNAFVRLDPQTRLTIVAILLIVASVVAAVWLWHRGHPTTEASPQAQSQPWSSAPTDSQGRSIPPTASPGVATVSSDSVNLLLGNPSAAMPDPSQRNNYLMVKPFYALSFNNDKGTPNWVSWRVTSADLGEAPRKQLFDTDTTLPAGFYRVTHKDYTNSGFDRGHMCPHSDRAANQAMSYATFVMTNIIPQAPNVNEKAWAQLEVYCRDLVGQSHHLYIVSGPLGRGGTGSKGFRESLAGEGVTVPSACWKVIVAVPEDAQDDLAKITAVSRVIAVIMPNDNNAVGEEWARFRVTPAEIERLTGLRFFTNLPADVAESLRQKRDDTYVPPPKPMRYGN